MVIKVHKIVGSSICFDRYGCLSMLKSLIKSGINLGYPKKSVDLVTTRSTDFFLGMHLGKKIWVSGHLGWVSGQFWFSPNEKIIVLWYRYLSAQQQQL